MTEPICDWIPPTENLFERIKPKSIIEFGLGEGTKFFLDNYPRVLSVEIYTSNQELAESFPMSDLRWVDFYKEEFAHYNNWEVFTYDCGELMIKAEKEVRREDKMQDPFDDKYMKEINKLIKFLFKKEKFDYAFVDHGMHLRGDFVNALFGVADAIGLHDTNTPGSYGNHRVKPPKNYTEEEYPNGCGTKFWVKNDNPKRRQK